MIDKIRRRPIYFPTNMTKIVTWSIFCHIRSLCYKETRQFLLNLNCLNRENKNSLRKHKTAIKNILSKNKVNSQKMHKALNSPFSVSNGMAKNGESILNSEVRKEPHNIHCVITSFHS
jgi:hypothetical protein